MGISGGEDLPDELAVVAILHNVKPLLEIHANFGLLGKLGRFLGGDQGTAFFF